LEVGRLTLLGTCGENVQEMRRVCTLKDSLDIMEAHLMFNHLAPSSPSSLLTAPALKDSMVIDNLPNVYFAGGNDTFLSRTLTINKQSCKLLLIPSF
jgi:DNA polymerase delta subunit 2